MSTFDISNDAPNMLRYEAVTMSVKLDRTSDTTARISRTVPMPAAGCSSEDQAYCGIVITLDTVPANISKTPTNGVMYTSDSNVDQNVFVGDSIGTSKVVGAFYNDRTSTYVDLTGLSPNVAYYVTGYPVDCELRYYVE